MNYKLRKQLNEDATNNSFEEKVAEVKQQLQNGADPKNVFDWVYGFSNGFAKVKLESKYNFINTDGNLLSDNLWFDGAADFSYGSACVKLGERRFFIDTDGKLYTFDERLVNAKQQLQNGVNPEDVFDYVGQFQYGFAGVKLDDKWNLINTDGEILCDDLWFDWVYTFSEGLAVVRLNDKYNFINTNGNILSEDLWFDDVSKFQDGFARVKLDNKTYEIDTNGNLYDKDKNLIN